MKALIQRVTHGSVTIDGKIVGNIESGYVVFLAVEGGDTEKQADLLAEKTIHLRIMRDNKKNMNRSIMDTKGQILVISQFTLVADTKKGRRPSFIKAAKPDVANRLYQQYVDKLRELGIKNVQTGEFGAMMSVEITNDGPVTIMLDTKDFNSKFNQSEKFNSPAGGQN